MVKKNKEIKECVCDICGYTWISKVNEPRCCPQCKRPDWNDESYKKKFGGIKPLPICEHLFKIFNDPDLKKTGFLSFYCQKCLILVKKKKVYGNGEEKKE